MSAQVTTDQLWAKPWQAREQAAIGTFEDTADGAATLYTGIFGQLPFVTKSGIKINNSYRDVTQIGVEDIAAIKRGNKMIEFNTTFQPSDTYKTFLKYLANASNYPTPTGTPAKPLSMFFSAYVDNGSGTLTETYYKFTGVRVKTSTWSVKEGSDWEISVDWVCLDCTIGTTGLATATAKTAFPAEETWDFDDGGAGHITFGGNTLRVKEFSATFDRKTNIDFVTGNRIGYDSKTHGRRIAGTLKILYLGLAQWTGFEADTPGTLAVVAKTGQYTFTLTGAKLKDLTEDHDAEGTEGKAHTWGWSCTGFTNLA